MITDVHALRRNLPIGGLLTVAAIWFGGMSLAATLVRPDSVVAFGPPGRLIAAVAASDGYLLDAGSIFVAARTAPSTVRSLYASGAWLVWPILGKGCGRLERASAIDHRP